ncbi:MAG: carboxypeptidase-like regulatory domain-containing protein [Planctomycetota bacterium]
MYRLQLLLILALLVGGAVLVVAVLVVSGSPPREAEREDSPGLLELSVRPTDHGPPVESSVESRPARESVGLEESDGTEPPGSNTGARSQDSEATLTFFGRVLRAEDDTPIAGAKVTLPARALPAWLRSAPTNRGEPDRKGILGELATDANGLFSAEARSRSECLACVEAEGYARQTVLITPEHATREAPAAIRLWRGASVRATVTDGTGQPLNGITVCLSGSIAELKDKPGWDIRFAPPIWAAKTDHMGQCTLAGIYPDADLTVALEREKDPLPCRSPGIIRLQAGEARDLRLRVVAKVLRGVMLDQHDIPVAGCEVWVREAESTEPHLWSEAPTARTVTDSSGRFGISLAPGLWYVGPRITRREGVNEEHAVAPLAQVVRIDESGGDQDVILRVYRGLFIRGRVVDPKGAVPIVGCTVFGISWSYSGQTEAEMKQDGTFTLGSVPPGEYVLGASPEDLT